MVWYYQTPGELSRAERPQNECRVSPPRPPPGGGAMALRIEEEVSRACGKTHIFLQKVGFRVGGVQIGQKLV